MFGCLVVPFMFHATLTSFCGTLPPFCLSISPRRRDTLVRNNCVVYGTHRAFFKRAGEPSSLQHEVRLPASEHPIHLGLILFGPAFKIFFGHAGSAVVYLGGLRGRNASGRIDCSGNAKPSIYSWCVHLFKQIYSIIWHERRESSGRGVRYTSSALQEPGDN
jgi:hypothetical protein